MLASEININPNKTMNAIKLPVKTVDYPTHTELQDADGVFICSIHWPELSKKIALALNYHDALVEALKDAHAVLDDGSAESDEGPLLPKIKAALAKVEDLQRKISQQ